MGLVMEPDTGNIKSLANGSEEAARVRGAHNWG